MCNEFYLIRNLVGEHPVWSVVKAALFTFWIPLMFFPLPAALFWSPLVALLFIVLLSTLYLLLLTLLLNVLFLYKKRAQEAYQRDGELHRQDQLLLYSAGFLFLDGKSVKVYRWENISTNGFHENGDLLPWSMVEKAEVGSDFLLIRKEGRTSDWYRAPIYRVPNAALL